MIIDTHSQLTTKEAIDGIPGHLVAGYGGIFHNIAGGGLPGLIADMDEAGVAKSVVVAIDAVTTHRYAVTNDMVAGAVAAYPDRLIGFASVDPHKGKLAADELEYALGAQGLKGLKIVPNLIEMYADNPALYPLYEIMQDRQLPVLFHAGTLFYTGIRLKYGQPVHIDDVAVDFPRLKIIIAHFGFPWFYETLAIAQRNPNVYFNIAGWRPKYIPQDVMRYISGALESKSLFGSDYPLLKRAELLRELRELGVKEKTLRAMTEDNPARLLGL